MAVMEEYDMRYDATAGILPVLVLASVASGHGSMNDPVSRVYSIYLEGPEQPQSAAAQAAIAAPSRSMTGTNWSTFIPGIPSTRNRFRITSPSRMDVLPVETMTSTTAWTCFGRTGLRRRSNRGLVC